MERIAIFAALRWECAPVLRQMRQVERAQLRGQARNFVVWRGRTARREVWLVKTGVGTAQAEHAAQLARDTSDFALFVSTGCAGALAPELIPGDLTVASSVVGHASGDRFETDPRHREHACRAAERAALRISIGAVVCSPHVLATTAAKRAAAAPGTVAVEMEGVPIAACAAHHRIPFLSVRAILDTADTELRHSGQFIEPQSGAVKPWALATYLATHPSAVPDLLALQRTRRAAQRSLERFFATWFAEPLVDH